MVEKEIEEFINKQNINGYIPKEFCPVKEEITLLGDFLLGRRHHSYLSCVCFQTVVIRNLWGEIELNNFQSTEKELKKVYENNLSFSSSSNYSFEKFIEVAKKLAKTVNNKEYIELSDIVEKMYNIREFCMELSWTLNKDEQEHLKFRMSILANSERLNKLSIEQIKNFLTSYNEESYNDVLTQSSSLTNDLTIFLEQKTVEQDKGLNLPFELLTRAINGLRRGQLISMGMMSNNGKTRLMIRLASNLALVQNKKILIISNEMTENDIKYCFITSVINNEDFEEIFNTTDITKTEREIRNGIYVDNEQEEVKKIMLQLEENFSNNVTIIHTTHYSARDLKDIILTHYIENGIDYFFYDTLKADIESMASWDGLKAIATVLSELAKEYNITILTNIQLVNRPQPLQANVENIANSKQLYHVLDTLLYFVPVEKSKYKDFRYWGTSENPTKKTVRELETNKKYYVCQIAKNRIGAKPNLLFEVNLDKNTWKEIGQVAYYESIKGIL